MPEKYRKGFPSDFLFGTATAAYQIEGAYQEGGRGASIWDTFSHTKGNVKNGDTGDVACDHYHRWASDLDLLVELGVDAYRFSIAWPRLFPNGGAQLNQQGVAFYDQLIDGCRQRGLKTFVTLYHWDLPQALEDTGGWSHRDTAEHFAHYAQTVVELFGDRVDAICTFNEPWCSSILSHLLGVHAPGGKNLEKTLSVIHGQNRAHGLAIQAMRAQNSAIPAGIVLNAQSIRAASESAEDKAAALRHHDFHNGLFFDPLFAGRYPSKAMEAFDSKFPENWEADMEDICQPLDYWGLNYYTPEYVADSSQESGVFPNTQLVRRDKVARTDIGWEIDATGLSDVLTTLYQNYKLPDCYITENGAAFNDGPIDGVVNDKKRIDYLQSHLSACQKSMEEGIPLKGYFAWSLMDNFEWAEGYTMRFGLIHVDYVTQKRTLKNSALWYRALIAESKQRKM